MQVPIGYCNLYSYLYFQYLAKIISPTRRFPPVVKIRQLGASSTRGLVSFKNFHPREGWWDSQLHTSYLSLSLSPSTRGLVSFKNFHPREAWWDSQLHTSYLSLSLSPFTRGLVSSLWFTLLSFHPLSLSLQLFLRILNHTHFFRWEKVMVLC